MIGDCEFASLSSLWEGLGRARSVTCSKPSPTLSQKGEGQQTESLCRSEVETLSQNSQSNNRVKLELSLKGESIPGRVN